MTIRTVVEFVCAVGFFGVLFGLMFHLVPPENREMLNNMLGLLGVVLMKIIDAHKPAAQTAPPVPLTP